MPLSERLREELDRLEAANRHRLDMDGSEPRANFSGLTIDEFANVPTHPFWSEIRELHISNAPRLTALPDLPRQLQVLRLYETGVQAIPDPLPPSLTNLILTGNKGIQIPNEIPRRIEFVVLQRNGLRELPYIYPKTRFTIQEPDLEEPFRPLYDEYYRRKRDYDRARPITDEIRTAYSTARRALQRGIKDIWSKRKANVRAKARNVGTLRRLEKQPFSGLPESVSGEIASYLSGEAAHAAPEEQMAALQEKHGKLPRGLKGGTRKRKTRRAQRN